jgi:hypothetical protein
MGSILGTPVGVAETDRIFMIAKQVADGSIEFRGSGWESDGSVKKATFGAPFQAAENMLSGFHVPGARTMGMCAQQLHTDAEVWPSRYEQPSSNASHEALVLLHGVRIQRGVNGRLWDALDAEAWPVRGLHGVSLVQLIL